MIDDYQFGSITINGRTYTEDVEVLWTGRVLPWQREEGHLFDKKDLERAVEQEPNVIILGIGAYGQARVSEKTQDFLRKKEIKLIVDKTEEAVRTFNILCKKTEEKESEKVIGLFHLSC